MKSLSIEISTEQLQSAIVGHGAQRSVFEFRETGQPIRRLTVDRKFVGKGIGITIEVEDSPPVSKEGSSS